MLQSRDITSYLRRTHENRPKIESCPPLPGQNFEPERTRKAEKYSK